jgi:hypothetical protein
MLDETAVREKMMHVKGLLDEATYRLRSEFNDPLLEVVRAPERVPVDSVMKPCYYVVIRWNEGAPPTVINLEGPDGEFVDLDGNIDAAVAMMRRNNFRDPEVRRRFEQAHEREQREAELEKERDREERLEEMRDRINAATRTSVSMNRDQPWSQNASGRRYRRKAG